MKTLLLVLTALTCLVGLEAASTVELDKVLCDAKWRCMRCHRWNWALKPPYKCTNCGAPMDQG